MKLTSMFLASMISMGGASDQPTQKTSNPTPIRQASARYKIQRVELVTLPDGAFKQEYKEICRGNMQLDVYDLRVTRGGLVISSKNANASCVDAEKNKTLDLNALIVYANYEVIDTIEEVKYAYGFLTAGTGSNFETTNSAGAGSKDLNAHSFVLTISPAVTPGSTDVNYSAVVDIQD